ncbi:MAG: diacylglycerol/lipid kinase family protein [Sphingomonadaceae bacterium]
MKHVHLIYNPASGSVGTGTVDAITAAVAAADGRIDAVTCFPDDALPTVADLEGIDTVIVAAGDGTINTAAKALDDWPGRMLVLPGGTMNLLPKLLHASTDSAAILPKVRDADARPLATVSAGEQRALVGALIGPAAIWVHAREAVRKGRWHRLRRAIGLAWTKSFGHSVRVIENGKRSRSYRAIYIAPEADRLRVVKVTARGWRDGVAIGWYWLRGNVVAAEGVTEEMLDSLTLASSRPTFALFDGEPSHLPIGTVIAPGTTRLAFVTTAP